MGRRQSRWMAWVGGIVLASMVSLASAADFSVPVSGVNLEPMGRAMRGRATDPAATPASQSGIAT